VVSRSSSDESGIDISAGDRVAGQPADLAADNTFDEPGAPHKDRNRGAVLNPKLGLVGTGRFVWRLLTSMRTALVLLVMLAVAAIPGSLVPQRSSDPNGVVQFKANNPELFDIYESFKLFDTYSSPWFSAIYLLLFVSLIGCILPRIAHHWRVLRQDPPAAPKSFARLEVNTDVPAPDGLEVALTAAELALRRSRYRVVREGNTLRAERGYLRETGNLVFHVALVGILFSVGFASGFGWSGQRIIVEGQAFTNQLSSYETFNPGRFFDEQGLEPYAVQLNSFVPEYKLDLVKNSWMPIDFTADVTVTDETGSRDAVLKVNDPLTVGGSTMYLLGNGFAPVITVRDGDGNVVFSQPVSFLSQDANLTSVGVVKVPDGLTEQLGMKGFFYPTATKLDSGALTSSNPNPDKPTVTFNVYTGDLGLGGGAAANVFELNTDDMKQIAGNHTDVKVVLGLGDSVTLPGGLGSVEFTELRRFIGVDIRHDPTQLGVGLATAFAIGGLLISFGTRRRRVWVVGKSLAKGEILRWGAQSRSEDPGLVGSVDRIIEAAATRVR
jgi:cytochrome c biogenesis protein